MKMLKNLFFVALSLAIFASCSDDDDKAPANTSRVQVAIKTSTTSQPGSASLKNATVLDAPLQLEELYINISEIEFDIDDDMEDLLPGNDSVYSDIELKGPFPIDLLSDEAPAGMVLTTTNVPNATYEEIEFEFEKYEGTDEKFINLNGYTIYAAGIFAMDGIEIPFVIKSEEDLEIELEYNEGGLVLDGTSSKVLIDLNLGTLLTKLMEGVDFANAVKEEDGSYLISNEKNKKILEAFEDAVENSFEAFEDGDDDDDDDDDNDDD